MTNRIQDTTADHPREPTTGSDRSNARTNVGRWDRVASAVIGGVLVARGLRRRSLRGVATAVAGGALIVRGLTGRSRLYRALETSTAGDDGRLVSGATAQPPTVERTITVGESADELAAYWRDPSNLNRIVGDFLDVAAESEGADHRNRWRVEAPFGRTLEWETRLVEDEPEDYLRWESLEGAPVPHEGTVSFESAPGDRGTAVSFRLQYDPPGGSVGNAAMRALGIGPDVLVGTALRRFKSLAETGEIPTLEANPSGRGSGDRL